MALNCTILVSRPEKSFTCLVQAYPLNCTILVSRPEKSFTCLVQAYPLNCTILVSRQFPTYRRSYCSGDSELYYISIATV